MHSRSLLPLLALAAIAAVLAAGCVVPSPAPVPPGTTVGDTLPPAATTEPVATPLATSPATTAPPGSPTEAASPGATPSARPTGDSGDTPRTEATTPTASPTVTATRPSATTLAGIATTMANPTACATPSAGVTRTATATPTATVPATSTAPPTAGYSVPELRYLLLDRYGEDRFFYCDPDEYPVSRGDELERALEAFPAIRNNTAEFTAITARRNVSPPYTDEERLIVYREHKKLQAIPLEPGAAGLYSYTLTLGTEQQGRRVSGTVRTDGTIHEERSESAALTCPICLAAGTRIATPEGSVPVEDVREGMIVWTIDAAGGRCAAPVLRTARTQASPGHVVVRVRLSDGRRVTASPGHPTANGFPLGAVRPGDLLDGAVVTVVEAVPYGGMVTYDLLPAGQSRRYWADGVLLGSTLG